jgi:hypothetical protein
VLDTDRFQALLESALLSGNTDLVFHRYQGGITEYPDPDEDEFKYYHFRITVQGMKFEKVIEMGKVAYLIGCSGDSSLIDEFYHRCGKCLTQKYSDLADCMFLGFGDYGHIGEAVQLLTRITEPGTIGRRPWFISLCISALWSKMGTQWAVLDWLVKDCPQVSFGFQDEGREEEDGMVFEDEIIDDDESRRKTKPDKHVINIFKLHSTFRTRSHP